MKYDQEDWENYHKGIRYFNREKFFEAHEAWEEIWKKNIDEEDKQFLQGLIQAAAYFLHLQKGEGTGKNLVGAASQKLQTYRRGYWGTNIDHLLTELHVIEEKTNRGEVVETFPKLAFLKKPGEERKPHPRMEEPLEEENQETPP